MITATPEARIAKLDRLDALKCILGMHETLGEQHLCDEHEYIVGLKKRIAQTRTQLTAMGVDLIEGL